MIVARGLILALCLMALMGGSAVAADEETPVGESIRPRPTPRAYHNPAAKPRGKGGQSDNAATESPEAQQPAGARVWPLAPGTYWFSQPFGCVPQLGFYAVVPGCPPDAPAMHTGLDLAAPLGTLIYAAASGTVVEAGLDRPAGIANTRLVIVHDGPNAGWATEYLHWVTTYVQPGQWVEAGQAIAEVGSVGYSTGEHLHFGVIDLSTGGRIDPLLWLPPDPSGGAYFGILPGSVAVSFPNVSAGVPDYADPEPPPPPPAPSPAAPPVPSPSATPVATPSPTGVPTGVPTDVPPATEPPATEPPPTEAPPTEAPPAEPPPAEESPPAPTEAPTEAAEAPTEPGG